MRDPDNSSFQPAQARSGEFAAHLRHRCRHCRDKIEPTADDRNAFCNRKCFVAYFQMRCLACEQPLEPKARASIQRFCRKRCKKKFHRNRGHYLGLFFAEVHLVRGEFKGGPRSSASVAPGAGLAYPKSPIKSTPKPPPNPTEPQRLSAHRTGRSTWSAVGSGNGTIPSSAGVSATESLRRSCPASSPTS
jgi:hypothetical protein